MWAGDLRGDPLAARMQERAVDLRPASRADTVFQSRLPVSRPGCAFVSWLASLSTFSSRSAPVTHQCSSGAPGSDLYSCATANRLDGVDRDGERSPRVRCPTLSGTITLTSSAAARSSGDRARPRCAASRRTRWARSSRPSPDRASSSPCVSSARAAGTT